MVGRLQSDFRSGNIAEHLGVLLLKGLAAVAEVPRQEDVGIDAFATLLRRDSDGNSYAEDPFVVQLKSQSTRRIDYSGHEVTWLTGQQQPVFIGLVSRADSSIALYSTVVANQAILALHSSSVSLVLERSGGPYSWKSGADPESAIAYLGDPVLRWSVRDIGDPEWAYKSYSMMKRFLAAARKEYELLSVGRCSRLDWQTGVPDSVVSSFGLMKGGSSELKMIAAKSIPYLQSVMMNAVTLPEQNRNALLIPLLLLLKQYRELGVEMEMQDAFDKMALAMIASDMNERQQCPRP